MRSIVTSVGVLLCAIVGCSDEPAYEQPNYIPGGPPPGGGQPNPHQQQPQMGLPGSGGMDLGMAGDEAPPVDSGQEPMMEPMMEPEPPAMMLGEPGRTPVLRIPLRVHIGDSNLAGDELRAVLDEVNLIWHSQAGVCFEMHTVDDDAIMDEGFDFWFRSSGGGGLNGRYSGAHDIFSVDYPSLGSAPNPTDHPASRTTAHELGHGLDLGHDNCGSPCDDKLMSSGKKGWRIDDWEVDTARQRAQSRYALPDTAPLGCAAPIVHR